MWAILVAAGRGQRMAAEVPKQYLRVAGKTLLEHCLQLMDQAERVEGILLVLAEGDSYWPSLNPDIRTPLRTVTGGVERADSVMAGLTALSDVCQDDDWILVHDAARVCLLPSEIDAMESALMGHGSGGLMAVPVRDTLKRAEDSESAETLDRSQYWQAQTPQIFRYRLLCDALAAAREAGVTVTDEAMAMERVGHRPRLIEGRADNIKVTAPEDLALAEFILARQQGMH